MIRLLLMVMLAVGLSACATVEKRIPPQGEADTRLEHIDGWRLAARFSATSEDDSWSGTLYWEQSGPRYDIRFLGPLGQGGMRLFGDRGYATLRLADGRSFSDDDAEALLRARSDWRLPLNALRYWVLGRPAPGESQRRLRRDSLGRLQRLKYADWTVEFRRYSEVDGLQLPAKILLYNPRFEVRLVIDSWELEFAPT